MSDRWPYSYEPNDTPPESPDSGSPSPRTALLSPIYDDPTALQRPSTLPLRRRPSTQRTTTSTPPSRFQRERTRIHSPSSKHDLLKALIAEEYESKQTRRVLYRAYDQFQHESRRATEAEGRALDAAQRCRTLAEARTRAQAETGRLREELRLYRLQLENAQGEIDKAQDVLRVVEAQRDDAEAAAARARDTARRLNEVRLVEAAREEGRRMGFEEGVRRGREMGFDDGRLMGYDDGRTRAGGAVAVGSGDQEGGPVFDAAVYDEGEDEDDDDQPRTVLSTPQVIRAPSPPPKDQRSSRRSRKNSTSSISIPTPTPLPLSPPHRRPTNPPTSPSTPTQNSPRRQHPDITLPPDTWIPTANQARFISIPPPHELQRTPTPTSPADLPPSPSVRARGFAFGAPEPPPTTPTTTTNVAGIGSGGGNRPHRNSLDSLNSTNHSKASTALSQLDLVTPPHTARRESGGGGSTRSRNLSIIPEDTSSQRSSTGGGGFVPPPPLPAPDFGGVGREGEGDGDGDRELEEARMRDRLMMGVSSPRKREQRQKMADELRYSDPSLVDQWRRSNGIDTRQADIPPPPRRRPSNLTVPSPLSQPLDTQQTPDSPASPRHRRTRSMTSAASSQSLNPPGLNRRSTSSGSGSSVPEITIQPPSRPASYILEDRPPLGESGLLSPDHAHNPLPTTTTTSTSTNDRPPLVPTVPNSPVIPSYIYRNLPDNNFPPGFTPIAQPSQALPSVVVVPPEDDRPPIPIPPPSAFSSSYAPPPQPPLGASPASRQRELSAPVIPSSVGLYADVPSRSSSAMDSTRSRTPKGGNNNNNSNALYATAPVPPGVTYPSHPLGTNASSPGGTPRRIPLPSSLDSHSSPSNTHRRSVSLTAAPPNQTPSSINRTKTLPPRGATPKPKPSNSSLGSAGGGGGAYSHYDPDAHLDPAYLASGEYQRDRVTEANTAANGGGSGNVSRQGSSSALSYATLPGFS